MPAPSPRPGRLLTTALAIAVIASGALAPMLAQAREPEGPSAARAIGAPAPAIGAPTAGQPGTSPAGRPATSPARPTPGPARMPSIAPDPAAAPAPAAAQWTWIDGGWGWHYEIDCVSNMTTWHNTYTGYYGATDGSGPLVNDVYYMHIGFSVGAACAGGIASSLWATLPPGTTVAPSAEHPVMCLWDSLDGQGWKNISGSSYADCKLDPQKDASGKYYFGTPTIPNFTIFEVWFPVKSTQKLIGSAGPGGGHKIQAEVMIGTSSPMTSYPKGFVWVTDGTSNQPQISVSYPDDAVTDLTCVSAKTTGHVHNQFTSGNAFIDIGRDGFGWEASAGPVAIGTAHAAHSVFVTWNLASEQKYRWRVRYVSGGQTYTGAEKTFTTRDCVAPTGTLSINGGATSTVTQNVTLALTAADKTGVTQMRFSNDGTTWTAWEGYATSRTWTLSAGAGHKTVRAQFRDAAVNVSATVQSSIHFQPATSDTTPPVAQAPTAQVSSPSVAGATTVSVLVTWPAATDASGIARYELQRGTARGAWTSVTLSTATSISKLLDLATGNGAHRFRVRAFDPAGNASAWAASSKFTVVRVEEKAKSVVYTGTWTRETVNGASGGTVRHSAVARAAASHTFTGRGAAVVLTKGADRGKAAVFVDGTRVATIDLYSASTRLREMAYAVRFPTAGTHTIEVRVLGQKNPLSGGKRVDLDAIVVTR